MKDNPVAFKSQVCTGIGGRSGYALSDVSLALNAIDKYIISLIFPA